MTLDWDFYFDDWLIDKIPESFPVTIEEHPSGLVINPPELTCYFGANPIYLYGEGKLLHEVMVATDGFVIFPDFLQRPGFEFVDEVSFKVDFSEEEDTHGNNVISKHVGMINAKRYLDGIFSNIYGTTTGYAGIRMPSSDLRSFSSEDYRLQHEKILSYQVYDSAQDMRADGCELYLTMGREPNDPRIRDLIYGSMHHVTAPGAVLFRPGVNGEVLNLRHSFVTIISHTIHVLRSDSFQIIFSTMKDFLPGVLLDVGSTNFANSDNYGFRIEIEASSVIVTMNTSETNVLEFPYAFDFKRSNKVLITKDNNSVGLSINSDNVGTMTINGTAQIRFMNNPVGRISYDVQNDQKTSCGDIEDLMIFSPSATKEKLDRYIREEIPMLNRGGAQAVSFEHTPVSLSYGLTYKNPMRMYISNFFGAVFNKVYLIDEASNVSIMDGKDVKRSITIANGFKVHNVSTLNVVDENTFSVHEKIPVLTKLTSDVHIPIRIHMKFKIPDFWEKKTVFNIGLNILPVKKMLKYTYRRFKTGEFV